MMATDTLTLIQQLEKGTPHRRQIIRILQSRYTDPIAREGLRRQGVHLVPLGLNVGLGRFPAGYKPNTTIAEIFYANP